jgi:glycosyltransferase involved in cell wall biosynthesis
MAKKLKIALVHDYLREYGGAERVLEALHQTFPDAPVYTAFVDREVMGIHWQKFADWDIRETWLAQVPGIKKLFSPLRFLAAKAFADLDLAAYDVVISSSNAYQAKAVVVPNGKHICYCHTPPRSLYGYSTMTNWKQNPFFRLGGAVINHYMRVVDYNVAQQVDLFVANSRETQHRIEKFYRRESTVIFPPVFIPKASEVLSQQKRNKDEYYLYVNRLAVAKHPDLAVQVCSQLGKKLHVVGTGPLLESLQEMAGDSVVFHGAASDDHLQELYKHAKGLLYPVEDEDFGIVPVEAMGYGVPVIAHRSGGPKETIVDGETGVFFDDLTAAGLKKAVEKFEQKTFAAKAIHTHATQFSLAAFQKNITKLVTA